MLGEGRDSSLSDALSVAGGPKDSPMSVALSTARRAQGVIAVGLLPKESEMKVMLKKRRVGLACRGR